MDKGTIVRTILLAITWINMILANYGLNEIPVISEDVISLVLAGIATVWAWFKNNYLLLKGRKQKVALEREGLK
ncbi:phage holin [Gracilibacillus dipsosauri]|uniref:Phage holin n=1 Tax=Gracilibacillus dipsosauri TaxID=178340 RepID=A0A317KYH4_9BACI|nr:phage holin [Gracilibacillus dipsosauri]PWU68326.1 phage holin [Gracilibacillus dipsosauri]